MQGRSHKVLQKNLLPRLMSGITFHSNFTLKRVVPLINIYFGSRSNNGTFMSSLLIQFFNQKYFSFNPIKKNLTEQNVLIYFSAWQTTSTPSTGWLSWRCVTSICLKWHYHEIFNLYFFYELNPSGPLINRLN